MFIFATLLLYHIHKGTLYDEAVVKATVDLFEIDKYDIDTVHENLRIEI